MIQEQAKPKVSIIIPVYNGTNYLSQAIECALSQTYQNIEILVINDGSCDDGATEKLALSYGSKIRYYSKVNGGVSSALNYGISKMTGSYFAWLSHDDLYSSSRIEDAVNLLVKHDMLGKKCVGFTGVYVIDAAGGKIKDVHDGFESDRLYSGYEVMNMMASNGTLYGCSFLIPAEVFEVVGGFDESLRYSQDSLMWYRIFLSGYSLITDNRPNVMSRMHAAQVSHTRRELFAHDALVIAKLLAEPLAKADGTGVLLRRYIKRLTRYECAEAVRYLCDYAKENGYMSRMDELMMVLHRIRGFFRYQIVQTVKKLLVLFRR